MILDFNENKPVAVVLGVGVMAMAIVRRVAAGAKVLLGDVMWFIDTAGASPSQAEPPPFVTGTDLPIDGGTIAAMKSGAY